MLRADYRESISQAVSGIRDMPSLEGRSKAAIAQAVVLRLLALCAREEVPLAALTNGLRWLLFLWSPEGGRMERRFCELDLRVDPEAAAADINRYLTKGQGVQRAGRQVGGKGAAGQ